jgi:cell division septal protein FtsQ
MERETLRAEFELNRREEQKARDKFVAKIMFGAVVVLVFAGILVGIAAIASH